MSCSVFGGDLGETYLTVMDSELGEDMLIFEAMHPGEEAELRSSWPEKETTSVSTFVQQVEPDKVPPHD